MLQVKLAPTREITRAVRIVSLFRFWAISILYIVSFGIAVCALGASAYSVYAGQNKQSDWKSFFALLFTSVGSGGIGKYLMSVDQTERGNVRQEEALDLLLDEANRHPEDDALRAKVVHLLARRAGDTEVIRTTAAPPSRMRP